MDWSTSDYTQTYADTIYTPEQDYDAGVYLLDEAHCDRPSARCGATGTCHGSQAHPGHVREGYYTGGNIISDRSSGNLRRVYNVAWDERPQHYNPGSGADWAHLVPDRRARPPGGGPAPSLAYPMITNSEAIVAPSHNPYPSAPSKECFGDKGATADQCLQLMKVVLVIIVVLLAMALVTSARYARGLEKTVKAAVEALRSVAERGK